MVPAVADGAAAGRVLAARSAEVATAATAVAAAAATTTLDHLFDVATRVAQGAEEVLAETVAQARRAHESSTRTV